MTGSATDPATDPERSGRGELGAILVVYVIPLLLTVGALWAVGLRVLAGSLLAVEVVVVSIVIAIRRRPVTPRVSGAARPPSRRPWLVPLVMVAVLGGIVGLAALASQAG